VRLTAPAADPGRGCARQIALAHGGQLTVRANAPRGAVFEISLPGWQAD